MTMFLSWRTGLLLLISCTRPNKAFLPAVERSGQKSIKLYSNSQSKKGQDAALALDKRRRQVMTNLIASTPLLLLSSPSFVHAADSASLKAQSTELEPGLLDARVTENVLSPPPYGMEGPDIYYPNWFQGTWKVESITTEVQAPCGIALFGSNATYDKAQKEIGTALKYESRFIPLADSVIADREYNVQSIAKSYFGPNSVVDVPLSSSNKISCILAPQGAPSLLKIDLLILNRRQETMDENQFACSEVAREIVAPIDSPTAATNPILREIETTSLYTYDPSKKDRIICRQRSATFLLPSQSSPMAMQMWQATRGRPVDVRFYDVTYTRR